MVGRLVSKVADTPVSSADEISQGVEHFIRKHDLPIKKGIAPMGTKTPG